MKKFKFKVASGLLFGGLVLASGMASASVTINFDAVDTGLLDPDFNPIYSGGVPAQVSGYANISGTCVNCYEESGFYVGTLSDTLASNHVHGELDAFTATGLDNSVAYHNDSSGLYIRATDGSAFKAFSLSWDNTEAGQRNGIWEILGFSTAYNTTAMTTAFGSLVAEGDGLAAGDGTNYAHRVAYQTVTQTPTMDPSHPSYVAPFAGTLALNSDFSDADGINAIWIHFKGQNGYMDASEANVLFPGFKVNIDNIVLESVTAVPVPAAVWMFGSALLGMVSLGRKKTV